VSEPWEDEGFGAENDLGEEGLETDLEENELFDPVDGDDGELDEGDADDDEQ
jgi:hypothetical protein